MDLLSGRVTPLEGYNHAIVITDDETMFQWVRGLKTKDDANTMIRRWASDISDITEQHPIQMIIRDNAGEFRSEYINEFVEVSEPRTISQLRKSNGRMAWPNLR
jgi:hypothetical protein